jgi:hypothetical protein
VAIALPHCEQHEKISLAAGFAFPNQLAAIADFTKNLLVITMVRLPIHLKVLIKIKIYRVKNLCYKLLCT